ncbi:type II toxin-antitoxin system VapB family antitoxin [Polaromonas sp.]|uniref:type II toxin-antitoxin system VapB family antitoxin n=1 Tax=Polaromonas sp. TaxID=1869339 RepID=UPI002FC8241F
MNTRTNIVLDDELVAQAMARARVTTKKAAVEAALRAYVKAPDYSGLLALAGTGVIADDYDPKALFTHPRYSQSLETPPSVSEPQAAWPKTVSAPKAKLRAKKIPAIKRP